MKNIGIVTIWFQRGSGYIATQIRDAFKWHGKDVKVHIFARASVADGKTRFAFDGDFYHNSIQYYPNYIVNSENFKRWVRHFKLDSVIFVEEHFTKNLIEICGKEKVKAYNYVVWENLNPAELDYYKLFDGIICPTNCTYEYLKNAEMTNIYYIKWGINLDIFKYYPLLPFDNKRKIKFFFSNGWGGVYNRKNQESVLKAFSNIVPRGKVILDIHSQKQDDLVENLSGTVTKSIGDIGRNSLNKRIIESDISLISSKWEGNGLPHQESLALGRPVITIDFPPMNERYGLFCKVKEFKYFQNIYVKSAEIDVDDLATKMVLLSENLDLLQEMSINSRRFAEENLDWKENSKSLINLMKEKI